jgi:hypothetical protein
MLREQNAAPLKVPTVDIYDPELIREFEAAVKRGNESVRAERKAKQKKQKSLPPARSPGRF